MAEDSANTTGATSSEPSHLEMMAFVAGLRVDRIIDVYIGKNTDACQIPESTLINTSPVFVKALQHQHLGGDPPDTLRFPDDNAGSWIMLLWWKAKGNVPTPRCNFRTETFVQAWIMGDKYDIKDFQDDLMLEIIVHLETNVLDLRTAKLAFENTVPGSPLRTLMAEELADQVRQEDGAKGFQEIFSMFEGVVGFTAEVVEALDTYENCGKDNLKKERSKQHLARFMVGDGPRRRSVQ
ncbi:uncharacterized protein LTR77_009197 [Saxophila tyrrhenica]|uniref:BTB domain-containing protein n=1 Tax=Saxophila tyrrhenica TaxID=1690608 RepID=A0AAV9NYZ7_9PEZI|nr:hypothetical protein LTR77_009197 [Saxophila tyrrhenica]